MNYVAPGEQLVMELLVRDLSRSKTFYESIGFVLLYEKEGFAALGWDGSRLFLDHHPSAWEGVATLLPPVINVRVMVPDVDRWWVRANEIGATVLSAVGDRPYGLRDFTIADPDGFGVRFATRLEESV